MKEWNDYLSEAAKELLDIGISQTKQHPLNCNDIIATYENFVSMSLDELESFMMKVASYNTFLKSQKGRIEAISNVLSKELERKVALKTQSIDKIMTKEEKKSLIMAQNKDLSDLYQKLLKYEAEYSRIKDVPFAIDKQLDIMRLRYQRRMLNEQQRES